MNGQNWACNLIGFWEERTVEEVVGKWNISRILNWQTYGTFLFISGAWNAVGRKAMLAKVNKISKMSVPYTFPNMFWNFPLWAYKSLVCSLGGEKTPLAGESIGKSHLPLLSWRGVGLGDRLPANTGLLASKLYSIVFGPLALKEESFDYKPLYIMIIFLQDTPIRHSIAHPWGRGMGYLCVHGLIFILYLSVLFCL